MKKVLVTDNNFSDREMIGALLKDKGFDVIEAEDGGPAVQIALKEQPDLILMGNNMLLLSGETAVAILRSNAKTKDIPIIIVSSNDRLTNVEKCLSQGANDYVIKPFEADRLLAKIRSFLDGSEGWKGRKIRETPP